VMVYWLGGRAAAGHYSVALAVGGITGLFSVAVSQVSFPRLARLDAAASLDSLGIDSLSFIEFMFKVEEEFGVAVSDEDLKGIKTLADLQRHVASALAAAGKA